jgi:hypothetical protein
VQEALYRFCQEEQCFPQLRYHAASYAQQTTAGEVHNTGPTTNEVARLVRDSRPKASAKSSVIVRKFGANGWNIAAGT